jgi:S1-C subfamily serine protease
MSESQTSESDFSEPDFCETDPFEPGSPASTNSGHVLPPQAYDVVSDLWQRGVQAVLAFVMVAVAAAMVRYYTPAAPSGPAEDLQRQVHQLTQQVQQLRQDQAMPALVLNRYRNSIGYIYGVYQVGFPNQHPSIRARVSGTGFLVGEKLLTTNRHVAEPWYGDTDAQELLHQGATATLESLVVFFPGSPTALNLKPAAVSTTVDLAVLRIEDGSALRGLAVLPLAKSAASAGELVTVIGYPMGIAGMVAKSPPGIYERMAYRHNDITAASELAALSLIRPSATFGHLGDIVGDKLIYDAPTAHGGSGGPVFDSKGEVIGVNSAYIDGFSGGTLGVSVDALRPLVAAAEKR